MGLARTLGVGLTGLTASVVEIEADLGQGLPGMTFTGLADTSVRESVHRIRAAVQNSDASWPNRRITVALLPADLRKVGSRFDLGVAMAVLASDSAVPPAAVPEIVWIAELGLDGRLRPVAGVLPSIAAVRGAGADAGRTVVVAPGNGAEAALVPGVDVRVAVDLREIMAWLTGEGPPPERAKPGAVDPVPEPVADLAEVAGQQLAKKAIEVAAAGGHHVYLVGAPGAGKTMLAERLPGLLPPLDDAESVEITAVHSVAGQLGEHAQLIRRPPMQAPHHTASLAALVGGGPYLGRPGAISLAHRGVLFLDEAPEFSPRTLDALRQPLESGLVVLHRSGGAVTYPARFLLVLAANPCPCGSRARDCTCTGQVRLRYQQRLSGPLLDRIDLRVHVDPVPHAELFESADAREPTAVVAERVAAARLAAAQRWFRTPWRTNGEVPGAALRSAPWRLPRVALEPAEQSVQRGQLSARGFDRVLRISWSLADLAGRTVPGVDDVAAALFFRTGAGIGRVA